MVSKNVKVITRSEEPLRAMCGESDGADGYTITPCEKDTIGTEIIMTIKDNTEDDDYDTFLDVYTIRGLIKKYSDYIRYPIHLPIEQRKVKEGSDPENPEFETYTEIQTVNSMTPLWKKCRPRLPRTNTTNSIGKNSSIMKTPN